MNEMFASMKRSSHQPSHEESPPRTSSRRGARVRRPTAAPAGDPSKDDVIHRKCAACGDEDQERLQPKLSVGSPADPLESEADRMADAVTSAPAEGATVSRMAISSAQRRTSSDEHGEPEAAPDLVEDVVHSGGRPLDPAARAYFEPRFGRDFAHVRVADDARASEACRSIGAEAFTVGNTIAFKTPSPSNRLVAHELTHVVQQGGAAPAGQVQRDLSDIVVGSPPTLATCPDVDGKTEVWAYPFAKNYIMAHRRGVGWGPRCADA